jgi:hypothetical protein
MTQGSISLLTDSEQIQGIHQVYFAAYQRPPHSVSQDHISQYLRDFRNWVEPQTSRWISLVLPLICSAGPFDVIVRALRSGETTAQVNSPLDRLCEAIAQRSGARYAPELLTKNRTTRTLQGLGGRAGHRKELAGAYEFEGSGLKPGSRILVVDDTMSTGSTLEAVGSAIKNSVPRSEITGFVLGKAGMTPNVHLDPGYFVDTEEVPMAERKTTATAPNSSPRPKPRRKVSAQKSRRPPAPAKAPAPPPPAKRKPALMMYVVSIVFAFVVLGAIVPLRSGKNTPPPDAIDLGSFLPPAHVEQALPAPAAPAKEFHAPVARKNLHPAIVTIPSVGLRTHHSLESKTVPKGGIRNGERVEIIGRFSGGGPGWLHVRTKAGKIGWVFASVVKEERG